MCVGVCASVGVCVCIIRYFNCAPSAPVQCISLPGLGFRRGSYICSCNDGYYFPDTGTPNKYYNGSIIEEEYEKKLLVSRTKFNNIAEQTTLTDLRSRIASSV